MNLDYTRITQTALLRYSQKGRQLVLCGPSYRQRWFRTGLPTEVTFFRLKPRTSKKGRLKKACLCKADRLHKKDCQTFSVTYNHPAGSRKCRNRTAVGLISGRGCRSPRSNPRVRRRKGPRAQDRHRHRCQHKGLGAA
jgi:hypothetical protein